MDRFLVYVKGGVAWSRFEHSTTSFSPAAENQAFATGAENRTAWLFGAGFEHAIAPNFSFFFEGDFSFVRVRLSRSLPYGPANRKPASLVVETSRHRDILAVRVFPIDAALADVNPSWLSACRRERRSAPAHRTAWPALGRV
jgi:hypothetical protein